MNDIVNRPSFVVIVLAIGLIIFLLAVIAVSMARFYRRCGADEALVRTGSGGNKVVIGGGVVVYPILHQLLRVSLRSLKLSVERAGRNALVTRDKIRANVTTELYIKVEPIADDVLAAARSFGERNLDEHAIGDLIEGKLTDALRSVAANQTFMDLHGQRKQFAESIQTALSEELKKNGLTLENVSITALAMVPVKDLDPQDVFDAEGLRAITDSVQSNAEKTNKIQREKELAIKLQNVEAKKRSLALEQDQAQAEADQTRCVAEYSAIQQAEQAKAVYAQNQAQQSARISQEQGIAVAQQSRLMAKQKAIQAAEIDKEKAVQAAEIDRQKALEAATIEKQKVVESAEIVKQQAVETGRIAKQIAVTQSEEQAARAGALKAQAEADQQQAQQGILTVEETAMANRQKQIAIIKSEEEAQQSRIAADREAYKLRLEAETRAAAVKAQAEGEAAAKRAAAEGDVARAEGAAKVLQLGADASAAVVRTEAQASADRVRISAEARATAAVQEATAITALAEATQRRGEAEAEARRRLVEAENEVASKFLLRDIALKALEVLPEVTRELMTPAKSISEIKVLQLQGMGGNGGGNGDGNGHGGNGGGFGAMSPVLKTILEAGAAYPLLREMMAFSQVDTGKLADKARDFLGSLPAEVKSIIESDPAIAAKLAELGRAPMPVTLVDPDIEVTTQRPASVPAAE
jgi:flotillin